MLAIAALGADVRRGKDPDVEKLQGRWQVVSEENAGHLVLNSKLVLEMRGEMLFMRYDARNVFSGLLEVDSSKDPKQINVEINQFPVGDKRAGDPVAVTHLRGIYSLDGDTLHIAWGDGERPAGYNAQGTLNSTFLAERAKAKDLDAKRLRRSEASTRISSNVKAARVWHWCCPNPVTSD